MFLIIAFDINVKRSFKLKTINLIYLVFFIALLTACAAKREYILSDDKIGQPKAISIQARKLPWVIEIERRLRDVGFEIIAQPSVVSKTIVGENEEIRYNESTTRYIVKIEGAADLSVMTRCMGGGYNFEYITVELFDTKENKVLRQYSSNGYSEGCQPFSGTIFADITDLIDGAW